LHATNITDIGAAPFEELKSTPQAQIGQFLCALKIKGTAKPVPISLKTERANEEGFECSHDVKHVLTENLQTSRFF
jgi:hypothetical protein